MAPPLDNDVFIPLSPLDTVMGHIALTTVYVFAPASSSSPYDLDRVRASLIATVEAHYPHFVGELFTDATTSAYFIRQTPTTRAGGAQAIPFESDSECALTTVDAVRRPPMSLLPARKDSELIALKATLLSDGGLALGFNGRHALLDGQGYFTFMNVWGMHYRGLAVEDRITVNHDRHLLMPRGVGAQTLHPEIFEPEKRAGIEIKDSGDTTPLQLPQFPPTTQQAFHLTPLQLQSLKQTVSHGLPTGQYVSTIDIVTALFTVLITQARGHGKDANLVTAINGRARFSPPVPRNYSGNCIFSGRSSHTADEMVSLSVETLRLVALRVRASVVRCDDAYMRDAIEFLAPKGGRWSQLQAGDDSFFGSDVVFTSWANMGMYKADFGAGTPVYAGPPTLPLCDGLVFIMDAMHRGTGLDVIPMLECAVMDKLTELWATCVLLRA